MVRDQPDALGGIPVVGVSVGSIDAGTVIDIDIVPGDQLGLVGNDWLVAKAFGEFCLFVLEVIPSGPGRDRPVGGVLEKDKGLGDKGRTLGLGIVKEAVGGEVVLRVAQDDVAR